MAPQAPLRPAALARSTALLVGRSAFLLVAFLLVVFLLVVFLLVPSFLGPARASMALDGFEECTIAVVSGAATADGRPLLWKNRDTGILNNEVVWFDDGKHAYLALVDAGQTDKAWIGVNDAGFAVLNSLSYNLPDTYSGGITNGEMMKRALQNCADIADFEEYLLQTNVTGRENPANLAVLDASGAAAIFEVGNFQFVRFDAISPEAGGGGFLVRANFSLSADTTGLDTWRYRRAHALVSSQVASGGVRVEDLLGNARDLHAAGLDPYPLPFRGAPPGYPDAKGCVPTYETINRISTKAAGVIRGVLPGEDARLATFFAVVGHPVVTPVLPLWVAAGPTPRAVDGPERSILCDLSQQRRAMCYDRPIAPHLINTRLLVDPTGNAYGALGHVAAIEKDILPRARRQWLRWVADGVDPAGMAAAEAAWAEEVLGRYRFDPDVRPDGGDGEELGEGEPASSPRTVGSVHCEPNPSTGPSVLRLVLENVAPAAAGGAARRASAAVGGAERGALISAGAPGAGGFGVLGSGSGAGVLEIFDAAGRLAARLEVSRLPVARTRGGDAWEGSLLWDGRDSNGTLVPSGVYFVRSDRPGIRPARLVIVR